MERAWFFRGNRKLGKLKTMRWTVRKKLKVARISAQRQRNVDALRSIIPGCEDDQVDAATLFMKAMEHIIKLELQVHILRCLTNLHGAW